MSLAIVAGMKKQMTVQNRQKLNAKKNDKDVRFFLSCDFSAHKDRLLDKLFTDVMSWIYLISEI